MRVIVVGAGVIGLTSAVRLLEAGHRVDVLARDLPLETTSAVAPASWTPDRATGGGRVAGWSRRTYAELARLAAESPESGVRMRQGTELFRSTQPDPWWADALPELRRERDLPDGYVDGWSYAAPVVEMPVFLPWLVGRVEELGGTVTRMNLRDLPTGADLVVNCAGIGSRLFAADLTVVPVRGQVVHVEQVGLDRWWRDPGGPTYVIPRERDIVVGGTNEEGEWSRTPSPETARLVLERAAALVPAIREARVLRHRVGLRPARPSVRLEREGGVVHNYGHGGAGVTLSWGCAEEVVGLVGRT